MKSIVYVHYQKCERDGSYVHTRMFSDSFRRLCAQKNVTFTVMEPNVVDHEGLPKISLLQKVKTFCARFFLSDIKALFVQKRRMTEERERLVQLNADMVLTRYNWNSISIVWAARSLGIPVVLEINAPDEESGALKFYRLPGMRHFFSTKRVLTLSNGAFAVSEILAKEFRQLDCSRQPVHAIPNGVCLEEFDSSLSGVGLRQELAIPAETVVIGFVGSFAPWHGLDLLFRVFTQLLDAGLDVHLLLVGQLRHNSADWFQRASAPDMEKHVTFVGHIAAKEVNQYLAVMDITVLANSAWYCSPLKVFEYMAMAKAVVAVATEPVCDMLKDGIEGVLFEPKSEEGFFNALHSLVVDPVLRSQLGIAARQRVEKDFSWDSNAQKVFRLLEEVDKNGSIQKGGSKNVK